MTNKRETPWLALILCASLFSSALRAQATDDEEIIVRGQRLEDFRVALEAARIRVYDVFNDLNSDDAFDVTCQVEGSTGTRMRQQTCRPQFKNEIAADAAAAWVRGIKDACPDGLTQGCIFENADAAAQAKSRALAEETREPLMQKKFALEMARVVAEHPEMQQVILDYWAVESAYDDARGRPRACNRPDPPARCSR
jgi:hypothetical protein